MQDLKFISKKHQRYEHGVPVMGVQQCGRAIIIKNANFCQLMQLPSLTPAEGILVHMVNTDVRDAQGNYLSMMLPKLMTLVSETTNKIELKGASLTMMGVKVTMFEDYAITLHLINCKVAKCVLHMLDRDIDIEYFDIHQ